MIELCAFVAALTLLAAGWNIFDQYTRKQILYVRLRRSLDLPEPPKNPLLRYRTQYNDSESGRDLAVELNQAGLAFTPFDFQVIRWSSGLLLFLLLNRIVGLNWVWCISLALMLTAGGYKVLLQARRGSLGQAIGKQLPEAVRVLSNGLHAGLSIQQGLSLVAREVKPPLGPVLQRTVQEMQLGVTLEDALDGMCKRVASRDLQFVVTTILLQHEVGGDLAGALDQIAATLVERSGVEGEIRTATSEQRYVALILPVVPIAAVVMLGAGRPGYIQVLFKPIGLIVLTVSIMLQTLGFWLINRASRIKV